MTGVREDRDDCLSLNVGGKEREEVTLPDAGDGAGLSMDGRSESGRSEVLLRMEAVVVGCETRVAAGTVARTGVCLYGDERTPLNTMLDE